MRVISVLLCALLASATARELLDAPVVGAGAAVVDSRALAPFHALELGVSGCWPLSIRVAEGDFAVEVHAQPNVAAQIVATVSSGTLSLSVSPPGFFTTQAVGVTVYAPAGALDTLTHAATGNVFVSAPPAAGLSLTGSGTGWLHVAAAPASPGGSVSLMLSGTQDVALCAPKPVQVSSLRATLSGSGTLLSSNLVADAASATLSGMGDLLLTGPPAMSARLTLSGSGALVASASSADVTLRGMGDIYVGGADSITGALSGMGHVYYAPNGASCALSVSGMGGCQPGSAPPPKLRCGDRSGADVDDANAGGWEVKVDGHQCQSRKPNALSGEMVAEQELSVNTYSAALSRARKALASMAVAMRGA